MQQIFAAMFAALLLCGCAATIVGTAADVAIEAAKIPVKAVVDVMTDEDEEE